MFISTPFVAIGHIANDIYPAPHLGGGVSYSAITARRLGYDAHIYTKCSPDSPYIEELQDMGIVVHLLPTKRNTTTSFDNQYDAEGHRTQKAFDIQESITVSDIKSLQDIPIGSTILVAPIAGEVDMALYPYLSEKGKLSVTPQGYFREIMPDGTVKQKKWDGFTQFLKGTIVVLSEEDIMIHGKKDEQLLNEIIRSSAIVALTEGERGVTVHENGTSFHTNAYHVLETKDFTGAGDVFAAVFISEIARNKDTIAASVEACFVAAMKIKSITGGIGIHSIPTTDEIQKFR
jgi:sugar/nucleoside kinase (ribokinase family)